MSEKTAFVFAGGASLGAFEAGMLKYLVEQEIKADMVLGTSVGSLNGAFYACDPSLEGVQKLEEIWHNIKFTDVFTPSPLTPVKSLFTFGKNLISPKNLRKVITQFLPNKRIEDAEIPLYLISTDIRTGQEVVLHKGILLEALMCSVAIPGVFPPQHMDNFTLVDGGLVNNTPISTAVRLGADRVVVFPIIFPYTPEKDPLNLEHMLIRTLLYILNRQLATDFYLYKDQVEIIIIPPPKDMFINPMDFSKSADMISSAYKATKEWYEQGGFHPQQTLISALADVHSKKPILFESIEPTPDKKAMARIKENVSPIADKLKTNINEKASKIKQSMDSTTEGIKKTTKSLKKSTLSLKDKISEKSSKYLKKNKSDQD